jgi:serine/threonine protein phosphatase PrpC
MTCETPLQQFAPQPGISGISGTAGNGANAAACLVKKNRRWIYPPLAKSPRRMSAELVLASGFFERANWEVAWAQITGLRHSQCEDSIGAAWRAPGSGSPRQTSSLVLTLADGVSGGARGDIAAHTLVRHCLGLGEAGAGAPDWAALNEGLGLADSEVNKSLAAFTTLPGAATLAAAWLDASGHGWITRVGDARLSVTRPGMGQWQPVLADQSYVNLGETPPCPEQRHAPARMVGAGLMGTPEIVSFSLSPAETLMLSSDGLHEWLGDSAELMDDPSCGDLANLACSLAMRARENGSDDDISVLLARRLLTID